MSETCRSLCGITPGPNLILKIFLSGQKPSTLSFSCVIHLQHPTPERDLSKIGHLQIDINRDRPGL